MRLHPGVTSSATGSRCRALVGGFGVPGRRDLDFGEKFVRYAETLEWPDGVVVEDLSFAAHMALHRLQELRPAKVVLVGAVSRGVDPPGSIRRYRLGPVPPTPDEVHAHLAEAVGGEVSLDHTLAVVRHWGALPQDTLVVEVEADDSSFGPGFSEALAAVMDPLLEVVRQELDDQEWSPLHLPPRVSAVDTPHVEAPLGLGGGTEEMAVPAPQAHPGIDQLFEYAAAHDQVRSLELLGSRLPGTPGLAVAGRFIPAGRALRTTGNWYDVIPLEKGAGLVIGDVVGRGVQALSQVAQLQAAVRVLALIDGYKPSRLIQLLDQMVRESEKIDESTLVYATVDAGSGEVVFSNAGHCPPLLLTSPGSVEFLGGGLSGPLGLLGGGPKPDADVRLIPGSVLLLFTAGLVQSRDTSMTEGLQRLRRAVANGPTDLEALCDHVLEVCLRQSRADDVSVLAVSLVDDGPAS